MFASLNDVAASVSALSQPDEEMREQARLHQSQLTKPPTALGQLEELAIFMAFRVTVGLDHENLVEKKRQKLKNTKECDRKDCTKNY